MKPHAGGAVSRVRFSSRYYTDVRRQILAAFAGGGGGGGGVFAAASGPSVGAVCRSGRPKGGLVRRRAALSAC